MNASFTDQIHQRLYSLLDSILALREQDPTYALLSPQEEVTMVLIGRRDSVSMSDLAKALGTLPNTMTGIVDRMVRKHLVAREQSAKDRRMVLVRLTEIGKKLFATHQQYVRGHIARIIKPLSAGERQALINLLDRITARLQS